jgi:hypothetical protein
MGRILVLLAAMLACAGCTRVPVKSSTPLAHYNRLIVRDINWKETATSEISGDQLREFNAAQPALNELFRTEFDRHVRTLGFFDAITYGNVQPEAGTLVLVPKIYTLKPGGFMPGASYTGLLMSPGGKLLAKCTEERRLNDSNAGPEKMRENVEKLVRELAEDAASRLPFCEPLP